MAKHWAFIAALSLQLLILIAMPLKKVAARAKGQRITLKTRPVDPYNIMSGYYVILRYQIERSNEVTNGKTFRYDQRVWYVVERAEPAWRLVDVLGEQPKALGAEQVAIQGTWKGWGGELDGAGRLYIPEDQRMLVDRLMREQGGEGLVELAVGGGGEGGEAAVIKLRIGGQVFGE